MHDIPSSALALLSAAEHLPKHDYRVYAECKRKLCDLHLEPVQFDFIHHEIVKVLQI